MRSLNACVRSLALAAAVLLLGPAVTGCSWIEGGGPLALLDEVRTKGEAVADKTADKAAEAVDLYCVQVPADIRGKMRDRVNSRTVHGDIVVTCVGDPVAAGQ